MCVFHSLTISYVVIEWLQISNGDTLCSPCQIKKKGLIKNFIIVVQY